MASLLPHWRALAPLTRGLLLFVPLACLLSNAALPYLPWQPQRITTLDYTGTWIGRVAHEDSWKPMREALRHLDRPGSALLYREVFFERGVKLQYPPTSLLPLDLLRRVPGGSRTPGLGYTSNEFLNALSWLAVLVTALLSVWILLAAGRLDPARSATPSRRDLVLQLGLACVAAVTFYPLVRGYYLGQVQTWIDALAAGLVLAFVTGRRATSGALAGAICLIKPQLAVLVLWAALRRQWRFAAAWALTVAAAGSISLAAYGLANHLDYLDVLRFIARHGEGFHPNQSVNGLLNRALGLGNNLTWEESLFAPFDGRVYWATLLSSALLLGAALLAPFSLRGPWRLPPGARAGGAEPGVRSVEVTDLAILITSVTLASPVAWTHHYGVLLPLFAAVLPLTLRAGGRPRRGLFALALAYVLVANNYRALNRLAQTPWNFLQSYVLFGGLLFLYHLYRLRGALAAAGSPPPAPT